MATTTRRFGLVDAGAAVAVALAAVGVIWSPKLSGAVAKATGALQPVTVLVDVRGIPAADPAALIATAREYGKVAIVIRNQPHGSVAVKEVKPLARRISAFLPDGKLISAPDPNQQVFSTLDARFVLEGEGRKGADGVVFGNQNLKIGAPVELEGQNFRVMGSVTGLRLGAS
ncbi:DUF4330 domain-containing protein [Synechococcus sp. HJ21-Hayes]|jgi:hypothetical protein|uniref:DUF4330 domain-containing protein n=1 Tax=unclassified Synechococcus TaxID=2626047 RepID=UPI0020CE4765|nr:MULTISPECIES: DUF4330 domain-containing protein [unclassified Synechococcus]MCP9830881.1 DUF4330 domain-containing protein [Synechococcus sp. JJ3a-Johnson]MCP9853178.1 DUF4330 domain-containing protein [Synechococcus sp. HJ21-Hayes]